MKDIIKYIFSILIFFFYTSIYAQEINDNTKEKINWKFDILVTKIQWTEITNWNIKLELEIYKALKEYLSDTIMNETNETKKSLLEYINSLLKERIESNNLEGFTQICEAKELDLSTMLNNGVEDTLKNHVNLWWKDRVITVKPIKWNNNNIYFEIWVWWKIDYRYKTIFKSYNCETSKLEEIIEFDTVWVYLWLWDLEFYDNKIYFNLGEWAYGTNYYLDIESKELHKVFEYLWICEEKEDWTCDKRIWEWPVIYNENHSLAIKQHPIYHSTPEFWEIWVVEWNMNEWLENYLILTDIANQRTILVDSIDFSNIKLKKEDLEELETTLWFTEEQYIRNSTKIIWIDGDNFEIRFPDWSSKSYNANELLEE